MHYAWKTTVAIVVAALLCAPATAEWYAFGNFEPSTRYDQGAMFVDPPNATEERVYFHVLSSTMPGDVNGDPRINANVGLLHTQVEPMAAEYHDAFLGVWQDCNGDGYIGMAETALREYSSALLLNDAVCPPLTGPGNAWPAGAYNYNGWVTEFIPIVKESTLGTDRRVYRDTEARVWGDFHRPDEEPFHRSCTLRPFARGTLEDTGGFINYVDCRVDLLGPANDAFALIGDPLGLSFSNEDDAHSGPLGHVPLGGNENSNNAAVSTVDCDAGPGFHSGDTLNQTPVGPSAPATLQNRTLPTISPSPGGAASDPTRFTIAGQYNQTTEELLQDCDTSNDFGHEFYNLAETDFNGVNPKNKTEADWNFNNSGSGRGTLPYNVIPGMNGTAGAPGDSGIGHGGMHWESDSRWLSKTGPRALRVDLENGGVSIAPAYWLTFYAHVGTATTGRFELPPGGGVYGSWHCGEHDSGIHHGWNCDRNVWYINPDQSSFHPRAHELAKPGNPYELRDVDCYDGRLGDLAVGIQPSYYGSEPCITVS